MAVAGDGSADSPALTLQLFISGATQRSLRAVAAVRRLCDAALPGAYSLNVVDIYRDPAAARQHQIFAVPTLVRTAPLPKRLFVGDVSDIGSLAAGLGLSDHVADSSK